NGRILGRVAALEGGPHGGAAGRTELPLLPPGDGHHGDGHHGNGHQHHQHHAAQGLTNGTRAPEVRLPDLDGDVVDLADFRDRLTVLLFWSPSCGFCQQMLPALRTWVAERPPDAPELLVLATGSVEDNRAQGLAARVLQDPDFATARQFGASGTPQAVLVGPDGGIASPLARGTDAAFRLLNTRLAGVTGAGGR